MSEVTLKGRWFLDQGYTSSSSLLIPGTDEPLPPPFPTLSSGGGPESAWYGISLHSIESLFIQSFKTF